MGWLGRLGSMATTYRSPALRLMFAHSRRRFRISSFLSSVNGGGGLLNIEGPAASTGIFGLGAGWNPERAL